MQIYSRIIQWNENTHTLYTFRLMLMVRCLSSKRVGHQIDWHLMHMLISISSSPFDTMRELKYGNFLSAGHHYADT